MKLVGVRDLNPGQSVSKVCFYYNQQTSKERCAFLSLLGLCLKQSKHCAVFGRHQKVDLATHLLSTREELRISATVTESKEV